MSDMEYHGERSADPAAGFAAVAPLPRARIFRLVGSVLFVVLCAAGAAAAALFGVPSATVVLAVLAGLGLVSVAVLLARRRRGEPT